MVYAEKREGEREPNTRRFDFKMKVDMKIPRRGINQQQTLALEKAKMELEILDEIKLILEEQRALVAPTMRKGDSSSTRQTSSRNEMERTFHRRRERMFR